MLERFLPRSRARFQHPAQLTRRVLCLEHLEERCTPAVLTVNSVLDTAFPTDTYLSLREAIAIVNSATLPGGLSSQILAQISGTLHGNNADSIVFDATSVKAPIVLGGTKLELSLSSATANITINGGAGVTVNANNASTVFQVDAGVNATFSNLTITGGIPNNTLTGGAGIYNSGTLSLVDCTVTGNHADNLPTAFGGGGIGNAFGGTLTVTACVFNGNTANNDNLGGGGIVNLGALNVIGSTFSGNNATGGASSGGAIVSNGGEVTIIDSTFYGNSAGSGGALFLANGAQSVVGCTITNNHSNFFGSIYGGGIYTFGNLTLISSIVAANDVGGIAPDIHGMLWAGSRNNLIGDGTGMSGVSNGDANGNLVGTTMSPINPLLGLPANNGGNVKTQALLPGSPAISAGSAPAFLAAAMDPLTSTLTVDNAANLAVVPNSTVLLIDGEQLLVTGVVGNVLTVSRGQNSTTAAIHTLGTPVFLATDQRGAPRAINGVTDIGAYESPPPNTSVSGVVFLDYNGDGVPDGPDVGLAGRLVFIDANNNGVLDAGELSAVTNSSGAYQINGVSAGTYSLRVQLFPSEVLVNYSPNVVGAVFGGGDEPFITVNPSSGTPVTGADLGVRQIDPANPIATSTDIFGSNNTNQDTALVHGFYVSILGRQGSAAEIQGWVNEMQAGMSAAAVSQAFLTSIEYLGDQVDSAYRMFLGRAPDAAGRAGWLQQLQEGMTTEQLAAAFLNSAEYQALHPDDTSFVQSLYENVLGRVGSNSNSEVGGWVTQIKGGVTRAAVVQEFINSPEAELRAIDSVYAQFLDRPADATGQSGWLAFLQGGGRFADMVTDFCTSIEFSQAANASVV